MAQTANRNGFTLIEVSVALAIVAIAASFALASYRHHLLRSYRLEAIQALMTAAAEQEKFYLAHGRYSDRLATSGGEDPPGLPVPSITPQHRYEVTIEFADPTAFRLAAVPVAGGSQWNDKDCRRFSIDESGRRQASSSMGADSTRRCW
jgi:type IV pilus assembly protein PilE